MPHVYYPEFYPQLHFHVRIYDKKDDKVTGITCAATDITAAHFAYENAVRENPDRPVRLMQWSRVLRESHKDPRSEEWAPSEEFMAKYGDRYR